MTIVLCLILILQWEPTFVSGVDSYSRMTEAPKLYEITGTLTELDLANGKGMIRTDLGKLVFLGVKKPELIENLSVGDRVTIQMKDDGQVKAVIGMKVPELAITAQPVPTEP